MIGTGTAFAQQAQGDATTLDRIEVTGTRIRQVDTETAQPVFTLSRADIEKQGFQSVSDILQNISAMGPPTISRASPLSAGEIAGGTYISMRNLGAQRTLVLVNGKRLGISTSGYADVSTIPAVAVERIEVLKDGASSTYGSDAIAGVINIITRSNYEGAAASAYFGQYGEGDGEITKGDFIMGFTGDRGSLTVAAEWGEEDVVKASDRPYSAFPRSSYHPTDNWTTVGQYGGWVTTATTGVPGVATGTRVILRPGGDPRNLADYVPQNQVIGTCVGSTPTTGCTPGVTDGKSNTNQQTDLRTPVERKSIYLDGVFDITDSVRFRTNLAYNNRVTDRTVAGYPMQATSFATSNGGTGVPLSAASYFNPTGATISNWWRRTWEAPRVSSSDLTTYRFTGAFEGSFEWADRLFDWDVSYLYNNNDLLQTNTGNLNLANTARALGPSFLDSATGQVRCGTTASPLNGCVAWNPFLPYGVEGPGGLTNNNALYDYLFQAEHATGETETTVYAANLAGTILALPAGDLGFAIGVETRKEEGTFVPDALAVTGGSTNLSSGPTGGSYSVDEIYLELQIPILADLPGARAEPEHCQPVLGLRHLRRDDQQQVRSEVEADRLVAVACDVCRWFPCSDDRRPVRRWLADVLVLHRSLRYQLRQFGKQCDHPCELRGRPWRTGQHFPPAGPGPEPRWLAQHPDAGGFHVRLQPDAHTRTVGIADDRCRVEPEFHRGPQHFAGLVEGSHWRHDRG